jgi:hypothetical protein
MTSAVGGGGEITFTAEVSSVVTAPDGGAESLAVSAVSAVSAGEGGAEARPLRARPRLDRRHPATANARAQAPESPASASRYAVIGS